MFCRRCGNEIDDEARFCPRCGARAQAPEAAPEAAGEPEHVLQVAEILAMDPADVPAFLESQGLTAQQPNEEVLAMGYGAPATAWKCPYDDTAPFRALDESGIGVEPQQRPGALPLEEKDIKGPSVIFGKNVMPPHGTGLYDIDGYDIQRSDLTDGIEPTAAHIDDLPLPLLDNETARTLIEACALPEAAASFETASVLDSPFPSTIHVGFIDIDGESYCWYIGQTSYEANAWNRSFMGCCPATAAEEVVLDAELYSGDEWSEADDGTKALMVGQSILQGLYTTNGGYRGNLVTGEYETSYNASLTDTNENGLPQPGRQWVTEAELRELAGNDVAESYFSFLRDQKRQAS